MEHGPYDIRLEQAGDSLKKHGHPLQPHSGVDAPGRQVTDHVVRLVLNELHEDQVPHLAKPLFVHHGATVRPELGAAVVEDLGRRSTWPGNAHVPKVVRAAALQPLRIDPDLVQPDGSSLVVALVDGEPETVGIETQMVDGELVCPGDGLLLEVVPKAEVAQHLEEGGMAHRRAHHLDVHGACHLLRRHRSLVWRRLLTQEVGLEGHHPCVGQEQRRVHGDQRGRGPHLMAPLGEVLEELLSDLTALHGRRQVTGGRRRSPRVSF